MGFLHHQSNKEPKGLGARVLLASCAAETRAFPSHRAAGNMQDVGLNSAILNPKLGGTVRGENAHNKAGSDAQAPAASPGHSPSQGSACLGKGPSECTGLFQPNNQPIHPHDCSIQDELTHPSHNRTLQMTLFNQENRFVLFLKTNESSFGCRGPSWAPLRASKSIRIVEET